MGLNKDLKFFGYFHELGHMFQENGSLYDHIKDQPQMECSNVVKYLTSLKNPVEAYLSAKKDFMKKNDINAPIIFWGEHFSDGNWVWPSDLPYYVKNYGVWIPKDFLGLMRSSNWKAKRLTRSELDKITGIIDDKCISK